MENEKEIQELKSAEELHRFEAGIMLGQTAVYLVASGALLNGVLSYGAQKKNDRKYKNQDGGSFDPH